MRFVLLLLFIALLIVGVVYGSARHPVDRRTVREFELERYMGDWYEIARYDHSFERRLVDVRANYVLGDDGRVVVTNSGRDLRTERLRTARGKAYATSRTGRLKVSFFWFFYSEYNVLELGDDYEWALVGSRSPKYLWILSRTPRLPVGTLNHILRQAERRGYKPDRLLYVDQSSARSRDARTDSPKRE